MGSSLVFDPNQYIVDSRNFVGALYRHSAGPGEIRWQTSYDRYRYRDRFDYPTDGGGTEVERDFNRGDWLDSQLTYEVALDGVGPLTPALGALSGLVDAPSNTTWWTKSK